LQKLNHQIFDSADFFIHFNQALVCNRVQQLLTKIYAQRDLERAKLFRNIRLSVRRHDNLQLVKDSVASFILYADGANNDIIARPNFEKIQFGRKISKKSLDFLPKIKYIIL